MSRRNQAILLLHTFGVPAGRSCPPRVASRGGAAFLTLGFVVEPLCGYWKTIVDCKQEDLSGEWPQGDAQPFGDKRSIRLGALSLRLMRSMEQVGFQWVVSGRCVETQATVAGSWVGVGQRGLGFANIAAWSVGDFLSRFSAVQISWMTSRVWCCLLIGGEWGGRFPVLVIAF